MKKAWGIFILIFILLFVVQSIVSAQTTPDEPEPGDPPIVTLTAPGANFANGASDGQCTTADASCTLPNGKPGICADNGKGAGVCTSTEPVIDPLFDVNCKPNSICHIIPEEVGRKYKFGQTETKNYPEDPTGTVWENIVQEWFGDVKPDQIYHYGTDLLARFGPQAKGAYFDDLYPAKLQDITLHDAQPKPYCMTSKLCVYNPVTGELLDSFVTEETWCTDDPPGRKELIEGTRLGAAYTTNYSVGTDLRLPLTSVKKSQPLGCSETMDEGRVIDEPEIRYVKKNLYGDDSVTHLSIVIQADMVTLIERIVDEVKEIFYRAKETTPATEVGSYENSLSASLAGLSFTVNQEDLARFSYPKPEGKELLTKSGGLWNTYRNDAYDVEFKSKLDAIYETQDWYYGIAGAGNVQTPTSQSMNARQEYAQVFGNCSIHNADDPTWSTLKCGEMNWLPTEASTSAQCSSTTLPKLGGGSCKLCNTDNIKKLADIPETVPEGVSKTLQDILSTVGSTFGVPPSSILAVMYHEGAFSRSWFTGADAWTDENVQKWSLCGGVVPIADGQLCDPKAVDYTTCNNSGSGTCDTTIAGFGWRPHWFWAGGSNAPWTAVQKIDPTRTKETISPCNVLDAAAATAQALSSGAAYVPPAVTSTECFSLPMTNSSIPGSCASPPWTDATVLQSHVSYAGYCPEPGKNGQYPAIPSYKDWVLNWYHTFSCGSN